MLLCVSHLCNIIILGESANHILLYCQESSAGANNWQERETYVEGEERGKKRSEGVVRGIIECLRGPHRHWAAGQGEENGVERRNKRLSQWERQREKQQGSRVEREEVANTFRVNC